MHDSMLQEIGCFGFWIGFSFLNRTLSERKTDKSAYAHFFTSSFLRYFFPSRSPLLSCSFLKENNSIPSLTQFPQSLRLLFDFVGSKLNLFRPKVMSTLRLLRDTKSHAGTDAEPKDKDVGCEESVYAVWEVFLRHLDMEHLGPILCEVFADLLPHFHSDNSGRLTFTSLV